MRICLHSSFLEELNETIRPSLWEELDVWGSNLGYSLPIPSGGREA